MIRFHDKIRNSLRTDEQESFLTAIARRFLDPCAVIVFIQLFLTAIILSGCGSAVQYTLVPDYHERMPQSIAVLPVDGNEGDADARYLLRTMIQEKFIQMRYSPIPLETVDNRLLRTGVGREGFRAKTPKELAHLLSADSVLYPTMTEWNATLFITYASLKIGAKVELYEGMQGARLWEAEFNVKESDMKLERDVLKLEIIKVYEPVVQRVVDALFSTIPANTMVAKGKAKKTYFDWLP